MEEEIGVVFLGKEHQFQEGQKQAVFYSCAILLSNTELGTSERVTWPGGCEPVNFTLWGGVQLDRAFPPTSPCKWEITPKVGHTLSHFTVLN